MQVSYNVPDLEAEDCSFDFTVTAKFESKKSKDLLIKACAKYGYQYIYIIANHLKRRICRYKGRFGTGMSIMEIEIPTGFKACEGGDPFPDPSCLKEVKFSSNV